MSTSIPAKIRDEAREPLGAVALIYGLLLGEAGPARQAALAQLAFVIFLFVAFKHLSWWALIPLGLIYSVSISWNSNARLY